MRASLFVDAMARGTAEKEKNLRLYSMPIKLKSEYAPLIDLISRLRHSTSPEYEMNGVEIVFRPHAAQRYRDLRWTIRLRVRL